jgi:hypothetical protein
VLDKGGSLYTDRYTHYCTSAVTNAVGFASDLSRRTRDTNRTHFSTRFEKTNQTVAAAARVAKPKNIIMKEVAARLPSLAR